MYALNFFAANQWHGFLALGAVVLAITGGEALYADMGHFGRRPIKLAWFAYVFPALYLNYLGQGALPHCGARRGGLIAFRYDSHSTARRSHTGERGIGFCHNA
jgi:hypothetical protein